MAERVHADTHTRATSGRRWLLAAVILYTALLVAFYGGVWRAGFSSAIPSTFTNAPLDTPLQAQRAAIRESDALYSVWVVGRNAYTLLHRPTRLFHGERCHPTPLSMALGESMLSLSLLGVPAALATGDPVATYNFAVAASTLAAALAMFWLVWRWTGEPAAGLAAGALYAFHTVKLANALHPYIHDTAWTVLGLWFAREWFARGRWHDALGLAASCSMQLAASLYPIVAAAALALPVLAWLLAHHGVRHLRAVQVAVVVAIVAGAAIAIFGPYLELRETTEIRRLDSSFVVFGPWSALLPGGRYFPGWLTAVLLVAGLTLAPRRTAAEPTGDPRAALVAGAALVAVLAAGGNAVAVREGTAWLALPNPYELVSGILPGLDQVRAISSLFTVVFLVETLLAGLGAAALLRRLPAARRTPAAIALVAVACAYVLRPDLPLDRQVAYRPYHARPPEATLAFFQRLDALGNRGPLLEVPMSRQAVMREGVALLASAYHHRNTSVCTEKSFSPTQSYAIDALGARLPDPAALEELRALGFTTVVVHHPPDRQWSAALQLAFREAAARPGSGLTRLLEQRFLSAYAIDPAPPTGRK